MSEPEYQVVVNTESGPDSVADGIRTRTEAATIAAAWEARGSDASVFNEFGYVQPWWADAWKGGCP